MNAIIGLCHFCELHGPSVLFCTQAFHDGDKPQFPMRENALPEKLHYGPEELLQKAAQAALTGSNSIGVADTCEGCTSLRGHPWGFVSNDHEARVSYISSQYPLHPEMFSVVRQACVRSLSCEVCPGREGPIYFGDSHQGHVLSYTFFMKDSQARGFQRWYSIIIVMADKTFLLNSWQFLVKTFQQIIEKLQEKANKVYEKEQSEGSQRAIRLNSVTRMTPDNFRRQRGNVKARSLIELSNDQEVFEYIHLQLTWVLSAGASRLSERLLEGMPSEDMVVDLERREEIEDGFIKICSRNHSRDVLEKEDSSPVGDHLEIVHLRELFQVTGKDKFMILAQNTAIGNQIIFRGNAKKFIHSVIRCLKELIPLGCCHEVLDSKNYVDSWKCNFLHILEGVELPEHVLTSNLHVLVDVTQPTCSTDVKDYNFSIHFTGKMPDKVPQVISSITQALQNEQFSDEALKTFIFTQKETWMNKVKVVFAFSRSGQHTSDESAKLFQVLGTQDQDKQLLKFWMTGLSMQFKSYVLSTSLQHGSSH